MLVQMALFHSFSYKAEYYSIVCVCVCIYIYKIYIYISSLSIHLLMDL